MSLKQEYDRIYMVATLPPKPRSSRPKPYQQKISTGQKSNPLGIQYAEGQARQLGDRIAAWRAARKDPRFFDWSFYQSNMYGSGETVADSIRDFKAHYLETHSLKGSTWLNQWDKVFRKLPQDRPLRRDILIGEALATSRDTRLRMETCRKLQHLADFAGLEVNLLQYKGSYGPSKVQPRRLPSDEEIAEWYYKIPNRRWQWVYGILAAGALRPHEAFFCGWENSRLEVYKGKTGPRKVLELFYPEWVDEWNLRDVRMPGIDAQASYEKATLGAKVTRQLKRYGVPFDSYDLRHAAAVRMSVVFGVPVTVAARLMGHSPVEHSRTYHRHIDQAQQERAIARVINASDRPKPPIVTPSNS